MWLPPTAVRTRPRRAARARWRGPSALFEPSGGGRPGTGKTALADAAGGSLLRSDEVRRDLGRNTGPAGYRTGVYSDESVEVTYRELLARARTALQQGEPVVLDASWRHEAWRAMARRVADETASDLSRAVLRGAGRPGRRAHHRPPRDRVGPLRRDRRDRGGDGGRLRPVAGGGAPGHVWRAPAVAGRRQDRGRGRGRAVPVVAAEMCGSRRSTRSRSRRRRAGWSRRHPVGEPFDRAS